MCWFLEALAPPKRTAAKPRPPQRNAEGALRCGKIVKGLASLLGLCYNTTGLGTEKAPEKSELNKE